MPIHNHTHFIRTALCCVLAAFCTACTDDDVNDNPVAPTAEGTFTDVRDGVTYHYVTYGTLDWMVENGRYQIADPVVCSIYQDADTYYDASNGKLSTRNLKTYGCLYTLEGA